MLIKSWSSDMLISAAIERLWPETVEETVVSEETEEEVEKLERLEEDALSGTTSDMLLSSLISVLAVFLGEEVILERLRQSTSITKGGE